MGIIKQYWRISVSLIIVLFTVTACFQGQIDDGTEGQTSSQLVTTVPPSNTPLPPSATSTVAQADAQAEDLPISSNPSETPTETPTDEPTPTQEVIEVAQDSDSPFELTATAFIAQATQTVVFQTQTVEAQTQQAIQNFPTETPTVAIGIAQPTQQLVTGVDCIHEVRSGETMYLLSRYYGILINDIAAVNGITNANVIIVGQRLTIPGCGTTGNVPLPTSTPVATVQSANITLPAAGTLLGSGGQVTNDPNSATQGQGGGAIATVNCVTQYTVQQNDTLFRISQTYDVPIQSIANANSIINLGRIDIGQVLCIPAQ